LTNFQTLSAFPTSGRSFPVQYARKPVNRFVSSRCNRKKEKPTMFNLLSPTKSVKSAVIGALFLGLASAAAHAAFITPVAQQLAVISKALADYGFTLRDADSEMIPTRDGFDRQVTLYAGADYAFAIACDQDCGRATLQIYDDNGNAVGTRVGNLPIVTVTPRWTGPFQLTATLAQCETIVCEVGVASFGR
jgi:hypothetical protein